MKIQIANSPFVEKDKVVVMKKAEDEYIIFSSDIIDVFQAIGLVNKFIEKENEREMFKSNAHNN